MVRSITLTFNTSIAANLSTVLASLMLPRLNDGLIVGVKSSLDSTGKVVTLTFSGSSILGNSLADGRYSLYGLGTSLLDPTNLFRLFGDSNGDGKVDSTDQSAFNLAYGTRKGVTYTNGKAFNTIFDYSQNGFITIDSQTAFNARLGKKLDANGNMVSI